MGPEFIVDKKQTRVLLVGYNGANNTGAEALLLSNIEDIRSVFGSDAIITVPTLNPANLRRYVKEAPNLHIAPMPSIYFTAMRRLVKEQDLVVLVEGSCYMDTWSSALLWLFLWATRCAHAMGKPCLAYAVDAGKLSDANQRRVRREASKTNLIVTRSQAASDRLRSYGVMAPIEVTADNAFNFHPDPADEGWYTKALPESKSGVVGMAVVDSYLWPVVMRPWGRKKDCYKWPYYFSRSPKRRRNTETLAEGYAKLADNIITNYGKSVALICMEQLDEPIARMVHTRMKHADQARIFSAREYNASQMTGLLRSLDILVTSRYHACVLSMAAQVPQVAVGHDTRLATIYRDLGLKDRWFMETGAPGRPALGAPTFDLFAGLRERVDLLLAHPELQKDVLYQGYEEHKGRARRNRRLLADFVLRNLDKARGCGSPAVDLDLATTHKGGAAWAA
jgi:polysaccharide pyruvyl transferase WcaK-like protein